MPQFNFITDVYNFNIFVDIIFLLDMLFFVGDTLHLFIFIYLQSYSTHVIVVIDYGCHTIFQYVHFTGILTVRFYMKKILKQVNCIQ